VQHTDGFGVVVGAGRRKERKTEGKSDRKKKKKGK
jgi:hypothetical protein